MFLLEHIRNTLLAKAQEQVALDETKEEVDQEEIESHVTIVEDRILRVTTAGERDLLYEMSVDELIGQLKIVTNLALSWPEDFENELVLAAFTRRAQGANRPARHGSCQAARRW